MFNLEDLHEFACSKINLYFNVCTKFEKNINVWKIPYKNEIVQFLLNSHELLICSDSFITIYWITFILAFIGFFEACKEMIYIFNDHHYEPITFGHRHYEYFSLKFRRRARICGCSFNIKLFTCLLYGLAFHRTHHMLPWLIVYGLGLLLEIIYWLFDFYTRRKIKLETLRSIFVLIIRWALTMHIMYVMKIIKSKRILYS